MQQSGASTAGQKLQVYFCSWMIDAQKVSYLSWEISSCSKQLLSEPDLGVQGIEQLKLCYLYIRDMNDT